MVDKTANKTPKVIENEKNRVGPDYLAKTHGAMKYYYNMHLTGGFDKTMTKNITVIMNKDKKYKLNRNIKKNFNKNSKNSTSKKLGPTSGYEPDFEPNKWNNNDNIQDNHNCFSYALNHIAHSRINKAQPGYFSNFPPIEDKDYKCKSFHERLSKDIPSMYLTTFNDRCRKGFVKAFLAIDPKREDTDYHFYRQDKNGYWSHKPGRQPATDLDANGKKITNPVLANRKYAHFKYDVPCFFFCFNPKIAKSHAYHHNR